MNRLLKIFRWKHHVVPDVPPDGCIHIQDVANIMFPITLDNKNVSNAPQDTAVISGAGADVGTGTNAKPRIKDFFRPLLKFLFPYLFRDSPKENAVPKEMQPNPCQQNNSITFKGNSNESSAVLPDEFEFSKGYTFQTSFDERSEIDFSSSNGSSESKAPTSQDSSRNLILSLSSEDIRSSDSSMCSSALSPPVSPGMVSELTRSEEHSTETSTASIFARRSGLEYLQQSINHKCLESIKSSTTSILSNSMVQRQKFLQLLQLKTELCSSPPHSSNGDIFPTLSKRNASADFREQNKDIEATVKSYEIQIQCKQFESVEHTLPLDSLEDKQFFNPFYNLNLSVDAGAVDCNEMMHLEESIDYSVQESMKKSRNPLDRQPPTSYPDTYQFSPTSDQKSNAYAYHYYRPFANPFSITNRKFIQNQFVERAYTGYFSDECFSNLVCTDPYSPDIVDESSVVEGVDISFVLQPAPIESSDDSFVLFHSSDSEYIGFSGNEGMDEM